MAHGQEVKQVVGAGLVIGMDAFERIRVLLYSIKGLLVEFIDCREELACEFGCCSAHDDGF